MPAFSEVHLSLLEDDVVELELKSPTASGQRFVRFHPVQFLRRLAWLIPPPKQNQVRYYGVFAPTHGLRAQVVPKPVELAVVQDDPEDEDDDDEAASDGGEDRYRVAWARLLKIVRCGCGAVPGLRRLPSPGGRGDATGGSAGCARRGALGLEARGPPSAA